MKTLGIGRVVSMGIATLILTGAAPEAPAAKQFVTKFVLTATKDGKPSVLAEPTIITAEGQQGSFVSGGEVPVDPGAKESLTFGAQARIKVRALTPDQLRVTVYAGHSELDAHDASNLLVREQGVHCVRTVKPGEEFEIDLGAGRAVAVTVTPLVAKP